MPSAAERAVSRFPHVGREMGETGHGYYYEVIDLELAMQSQTILADEMNGRPLPVPYGAPLRLRVENQRGYKLAKWINRIEVVNSFKHIGKGQGGWRDDVLHYYPLDAGL